MTEKTLFALAGLAPVILGLHHLIWPAAWAMPDDDDDPPRDAAGRLVERPHWQVRVRGLCLVVFGVLWVVTILFVPPARDPTLF